VREDVSAAVNYQICGPRDCPTDRVPEEELDDHIDQVVAALDCEPQGTVTMLTAARMENAGWAERSFNGIHVLSVITAGVTTNAARAGDTAAYYETADGWKSTQDGMPCGTVNILLLVDHPVTAGGLVKAGIMATEAKSATLQALSVPSLYSPDLATGTGTDQYVIACPQRGPFTLGEAQAHTKFGELIARSVEEALRIAIERQCNLSARAQSSAAKLLARFGATLDLAERDAEPRLVAAAIALAAVLDHVRWGIVAAEDRASVVSRQAAILSAAVAGSTSVIERATGVVLDHLAKCPDLPDGKLIELAIGLGEAQG